MSVVDSVGAVSLPLWHPAASSTTAGRRPYYAIAANATLTIVTGMSNSSVTDDDYWAAEADVAPWSACLLLLVNFMGFAGNMLVLLSLHKLKGGMKNGGNVLIAALCSCDIFATFFWLICDVSIFTSVVHIPRIRRRHRIGHVLVQLHRHHLPRGLRR
jgi:hypothetical protein